MTSSFRAVLILQMYKAITSGLLIIFINCCVSGYTQSSLRFTTPLQDAYRDIISLKIKIGQNKLNIIKLNDPQNAMTYYIENYADFFTLFIQEEETKYKSLLKNKDIRINKIKASDPGSPYYLFCQAEIILQWATIKLKFGDKINAATDVYEAYRLLEKNKQKFPDFTENNKSLSIIHALAESVPSWVRKIMNIKGSVDLGTSEIRILANKSISEKSIFKEEIVAIYSYILFYSNNKKEEAYHLFETYHLDHKSNPLIAFLKATMAQKTGRNETAIKILEERPKGAEYLAFYYLDYMYGKFKLNRLDKNADQYIVTFLNNFKGKHYIKEAWQKLAWYQLIVNHDIAAYKQYMKSCASKGQSLIDEDIQANREAKSNQIPNEILLRARLLFDGGYYVKCQGLLILNSEKFTKAIHDGEYYYRLARVTDALKNYIDALEYYDLTIIKSDPGKYYGCSAALQSGLIYEQQNKYAKARFYFEKCLALDPAGYSSSLHQKAKSGLDRVRNK